MFSATFRYLTYNKQHNFIIVANLIRGISEFKAYWLSFAFISFLSLKCIINNCFFMNPIRPTDVCILINNILFYAFYLLFFYN